ncbi:KH domain-containing protein [Coleofasciculus sp. H7-2]|uniref:KH domain-containing protein n=1 Tax=Coleofasciculus sp. H7-2 TaxID=3351545 RepID=UPI00366B24FB
MSWNKSVPQLPHEYELDSSASTSQPVKSSHGSSPPDYASLVQFLVQPFLESPKLLSVDCEMSQSNTKVWVRLAFEGEDKGRVFGRGGRNIQAIRTVIEAAAKAANQSVYLDIYGSSARSLESTSGSQEVAKKDPPRRSSSVSAPKFRDR